MKKSIVTLTLLTLGVSQTFASCSGEEVDIGGKLFCMTPEQTEVERKCNSPEVLDPDNSGKCISRPSITSITDASTQRCPFGVEVPEQPSTCVANHKKEGHVMDGDYKANWHPYAGRNQGYSLPINDDETNEIYSQVSKSKTELGRKEFEVECGFEYEITATASNFKYGIVSNDFDEWTLYIQNIVNRTVSDEVGISSNENVMVEVPIDIDNPDAGTIENGKTFNPIYQPLHSYNFHLIDDWEMLPKKDPENRKKVGEDNYYGQYPTTNTPTMAVRMGLSGKYEWSRGIANNPYLTDKGYQFEILQAMKPQPDGKWDKGIGKGVGEAGLCFKAEPMEEPVWESVSDVVCSDGTLSYNVSHYTSNMEQVYSKESVDSKEITIGDTCIYNIACPADFEGEPPCIKSEYVSKNITLYAWKAYNVMDSDLRKSTIKVTSEGSGNCGVDIENPDLIDDICNTEEYGWNDSINYQKDWTGKLLSKYKHHVEKATVDTYCSNVGVRSCGHIGEEENSLLKKTDFNYCDNDPESTGATPGHRIEGFQWWGWDTDLLSAGIEKSNVSATYDGSLDDHNQCQKEMCEDGYDTCPLINKAMNDLEIESSVILSEAGGELGAGANSNGGHEDIVLDVASPTPIPTPDNNNNGNEFDSYPVTDNGSNPSSNSVNTSAPISI